MNPLGPEHHNVILLGAGASFDADIPLLGSFVDKMSEYVLRGKAREEPIAESDKTILHEANEIRLALERYSSRAFFDINNLEDILSLLSFESLADGAYSAKYDKMVHAVARTIELSCKFPYRAQPPDAPVPGGYHWAFWRALLNPALKAAAPALMTFNYDLVLERTLWAQFHYYAHDQNKPKVSSCAVDYHFGSYPRFVVKGGIPHSYGNPGFRADFLFDGQAAAEVSFPYLKLHGSLNWDKEMANSAQGKLTPALFPTAAVDRPLILPPVFNKMNSTVNEVWTKALQVLRNAKHIIIVGYSLPKTDIYMQYFLKAAVGPNSKLQKIVVFDPVLFYNNEQSTAMEQRYRDCFSPQFSNRITFRPGSGFAAGVGGTFRHFVQTLQEDPKSILFYL
jgi:hypothetical protein